MSLQEKIRSYLEAQGYEVRPAFRGLKAIGEGFATGGMDEHLYVWSAEDDGPLPHRTLLNQISEAKKTIAPESAVPLFRYVQDGESIPERIGRELKDLGVVVSPAITFFDAAFRFEGGSGTTAQRLRRQGPTRRVKESGDKLARQRVRQPYEVTSGVDRMQEQAPKDLLERLTRELSRRDADAVPLHIVVGSAGSGKSVMFDCLFAHLLDEFQASKLGRREARRPIAITPDIVSPDERDRSTFGAIFNLYLSGEFSKPITWDLATWRLHNGYATWMIDGLDEVISRDRKFFDDLKEILVAPPTEEGLRPSVLICLRESMLTTNVLLQSFLEDIEGDVQYTQYRMSPWDSETVEAFLQIRNPDASVADDFRGLRTDDAVAELAALPFYCDHLLRSLETPETREEIQRAAERDSKSVENMLLDSFINDFIRRDRSKGLIDERIEDEDVRIVLSECAFLNYQSNFLGIQLEDYVRLWQNLMPDATDPEEREKQKEIRERLKQLAFFSDPLVASRREAGTVSESTAGERIRFLSDVIADYLFALELERKWGNSEKGGGGGGIDALATALEGPVLSTEDLVFRRIKGMFSKEHATRLITSAIASASGRTDDRATRTFRNLMQLALEVGKGEPGQGVGDQLLQNFGTQFVGMDLRGLRFQNLDLGDVHFSGCDLAKTQFVDCDLTGARLDARLSETHFTGTSADTLVRAALGDLGRFESAIVDVDGEERLFDDPAAFSAFLKEMDEEEERATRHYCGALEQLWHLAGQYRHRRDGSSRRDKHFGRTILQRGKDHIPRDDRKKLIDELVKAGRLNFNSQRDQYQLESDFHGEFAEFAMDRENLGNLRAVLDEVCAPDCAHIFD